MRTIAVVTGARSDYGIYLPLLRRIVASPDLRLRLMVTGMHLAPEFGLTMEAIVADGFAIEDRIESLLSSDTPEGTARSMGLGVIGFAQAFGHARPDILVVLGDRFEMHAAAVAALPFKIPVAHIHGGELSLGAIDDALRHSMTKLSHLHFVATAEYGRRVMQLGEESWRVKVVGALSLDNLGEMHLMTRSEIEAHIGLELSAAPLLVTFHPATLEPGDVQDQTRELLSALGTFSEPLIFTAPNADAHGRRVLRAIGEFVAGHPNARLIDNLGLRAYFSVMTMAAAMVGNSSSGIIEAASFRLPVVNIGSRQQGRVRAANVIDSACERDEIIRAVRAATSAGFRGKLKDLRNPYGDGHAADAIMDALLNTPLNDALLVKRFSDLPAAGQTG